MTAPYLGGLEITHAAMIGPGLVRVEFASTYSSDYHYQLYCGRSLVGVTQSPAERAVSGGIIPSLYPEHITVLAVDPASRLTDYGSDLPDRPYNRVKLTVDTTGFPADTKLLEVTGSTEPGGAVDTSNILATLPFDAAGVKSVITDPLSGSGTWSFEVAGRDNTAPDGNRGDPLELTAEILAYPPDLALQADGYRFSVESDGTDLTISFAAQDVT